MMMMQRELTEQEKAELEALNQAVTAAIEKRREWLDRKMGEVSTLKVGDPIFNVGTGEFLGTVSRLYRHWRDRDGGIRDVSPAVQYEYQVSEGCYDNTSRQTYTRFGGLEEARAALAVRLGELA
ncbi:MAG: hypothetical protein R3264_14440 [Anaerolineae bacterium]|nr:hypothetical protein [Anaerolineae bacterium]